MRAGFGGDAFFVSIRILHHEPGNASGVANGKTKADRTSEILQIERIALEPDLLGEPLDHVRYVIEGLCERIRCGSGTIPKPRIIGCDQMIMIRQQRDEIAEHVG